MRNQNKTNRWHFGKRCLAAMIIIVAFNSLMAQQRTWMLPYYRNSGATTFAGGVSRVPIINFRSGTPVYETQYIGGSFSTQAVGNGEYCNNCATNQLTKLSQFFISGRSADVYQTNANNPNPIRTVYTKWDQICGDTARVDTFTTVTHTDLAHESLNEVAIGDGENAGTFWVVMQQSPASIDGFGPGFYVYLMDMNNATINASVLIPLNHTSFPALPNGSLISGSTDGVNGLGEGVALGPKFIYVKEPTESNPSLIALNTQMCRSIYIANGTTVFHLLINLSNNTVVYSDSFAFTTTTGMSMEIDLNFPQGGQHPTRLGLTGWNGVYLLNVSPNHGKILNTPTPQISASTGGYGLEFDHVGNYMYYSLQGVSAAPTLHRHNLNTGISAPVSFTSGTLTSTGTYNNLCIESAIDGNIYGLTTNQQMVSIINPELATPSAVTAVNLSSAMFSNPITGANDLTSGGLFGLSLPDWVDGEVPLSSEGGSIVVKLPCALCQDATTSHPVNIYATDSNGNSTLVQHFDMFPCEEISLSVCPGIIYEVIFDENLPTEQHSLEQIAFPGDVHNVTFTIPNASVNYFSYNSNTTISTNTLWDNKVYIGDNVIVTVAAGVTLDITNVDVLFGSDAGIDFKDGAIIRANNSVFRPCDMNDVWRSLAFFNTPGSQLPSGMINECTFKNAKTAIEAIGTTTPSLLTLDLRITNNLFADCQRGIGLNLIDFKRSITGNTYMLENKALPFSTINTGSVNPPKTFSPTNANDYYGLFSLSATFRDLISQNDFIMTSDSTTGDQMSYAISLTNFTGGSAPTNVSTPSINSNKITDFSYGISTSYINKLSIENNNLEWTNLYKKVIPNQYKFHIYVTGGNNILIKNNKVYSANLINANPASSVNDGGTGGPNTPTYKSVGITANNCINVVIKQNEITGVESGIVAIGLNPTATIAKNMYIAENEIKKTWYYGIYLRSYENADISCNVVDMELKTGKDATGIGYFNFAVTGGSYVHPSNFALRGNCVLNTKNAIYCYNPSAAGLTYMPRVYNNFCYNYTRVGFENNGFTKLNTTSPYDINRNTFVSNNSTAGLPDLLTDASHVLTADYNYGIQNVGGPGTITLLNGNSGNSSASCAMQTSTNTNSLNSTQMCEYLYPSQSSWNPNGKVIDWASMPVDADLNNEPFELSDPFYVAIDKIEAVNQQMFDMYPVPTKDKVTIGYNLETTDNAYLEFIDIQGRTIKSVPLAYEHTSLEINVADFAPGIYIVRLVNEGKNAYYSKLIKQ